jgi:hypothetical protein
VVLGAEKRGVPLVAFSPRYTIPCTKKLLAFKP